MKSLLLALLTVLTSTQAFAQAETPPEIYNHLTPNETVCAWPDRYHLNACPAYGTVGTNEGNSTGIAMGQVTNGAGIGIAGNGSNVDLQLNMRGNAKVLARGDDGSILGGFTKAGQSNAVNFVLFNPAPTTLLPTLTTSSLGADTQVGFNVQLLGGGVWLLNGGSHVEYSRGALAKPAITTGAADCGTSPANDGNDNIGYIQVGTSTNGGKCTMTFANTTAPWTNEPVCFAQNKTHPLVPMYPVYTGTTAVAFTANGTLTAGDYIKYTCTGWR